MRLLHVKTKKLEDYIGREIPEYAILSHCWRPDGDEILYEDIAFSDLETWKARKRGAAEKVIKACEEASLLGIDYIWIDTCCIDKRSSSELSEAINSMFLWYRKAHKCLAFLDDVDVPEKLGDSKWFTRGWTLQELIAPDNVRFYDKNWSYIGDRFSMTEEISGITGIDEVVLRHGHNADEKPNWDDHHWKQYNPAHYTCLCGIQAYDDDILRGVLEMFSVASIMSWAAHRQTSREEDIAYCLMGLFDVNMPLLYGEKNKAFIRLQEAIIQKTDDQSILAWLSTEHEGLDWFLGRDLASSPKDFAHVKIKKKWSLEDPRYDDNSRRHINMTKDGLEADLLCFRLPPGNDFSQEEESYLAILDCTLGNNPLAKVAIALEKPPWGASDVFVRNISYMLWTMTPEEPEDSKESDNTVAMGVVRIAKDMFDIPGSGWHNGAPEWRQEFDLRECEMKKLTLSRILPRRGTHSRNRYDIPPIRVGKILDCDPGEYTVDYALPGFDKSSNVASPFNEKYGLALVTKQGSPQFYIAWGLGGVRVTVHIPGTVNPVMYEAFYERDDIWCKILPSDDKETKENFDAAKQWYRRQRYESTVEHKAVLNKWFTDWEYFVGVKEVDQAVLDLGAFRREVVAEIKRVRFLDRPFLDLRIQVRLPPQEDITETQPESYSSLVQAQAAKVFKRGMGR